MNIDDGSFANTIHERTVGLTALGVMDDCFKFGMMYGCRANCPQYQRGECEHQQELEEDYGKPEAEGV